MSESPIPQTPQSPPPPCLEEGVNALLAKAKHDICERYEKCEERVRKSPTKAVLGAVTVGYFLHRLPIRAIVVAKVRLLTALAPPALVLFGAAKACEFLQRQRMR